MEGQRAQEVADTREASRGNRRSRSNRIYSRTHWTCYSTCPFSSPPQVILSILFQNFLVPVSWKICRKLRYVSCTCTCINWCPDPRMCMSLAAFWSFGEALRVTWFQRLQGALIPSSFASFHRSSLSREAWREIGLESYKWIIRTWWRLRNITGGNMFCGFPICEFSRQGERRLHASSYWNQRGVE